MVFTNPLGLLALLSLPVIVALHFFRDRRRVVRIGGLHLWDFAKTSLPAGRRFERLLRSLSLWCQLLAALLASLLIAGLDLPDRSRIRHHTVVLDDSISMQAKDKGSASFERVRDAVGKWAPDGDKFTLIASGMRPHVLAGPFATRLELLDALGRWQPESLTCDLDSALNLASKFAAGPERLLFAGDSADTAKAYKDFVEPGAYGQRADNVAIASADRIRVNEKQDRILVALRSNAAAEGAATLRGEIPAAGGAKEIFSKQVTLAPGKSASLQFDFDLVGQAVTLRLGDDALEADNVAHLAPVIITPVSVLIDDFGPLTSSFEKAVSAVPYASVTRDAKAANLAFVRSGATASASGALRSYVFSDEPATTGSIKVAPGGEILLDRNSPLSDQLALEGVLWSYVETTTRTVARPLAYHGTTSLFWLDNESPAGVRQYRMNLLRERTNLFRQTAWPVMVQAMIEECRSALPGLARSNYRTGEEVVLRIPVDPATAKKFALLRDTKPYASYEELPPSLLNLPAGSYAIQDGGGKALASFNVNLAAPGESDLSQASTKLPDLAKLRAGELETATRNRLLFYALLIAALIFTGLSWAFHDTSR